MLNVKFDCVIYNMKKFFCLFQCIGDLGTLDITCVILFMVLLPAIAVSTVKPIQFAGQRFDVTS
jgi:hypothetical protein